MLAIAYPSRPPETATPTAQEHDNLNTSDVLITVLLAGLVLRQLRGRPLTPRTLVLPVVIVAVAAKEYVSVPSTGPDVALTAVCALIGLTLGLATAALTRVRIDAGVVTATATATAAGLWVAGLSARSS